MKLSNKDLKFLAALREQHKNKSNKSFLNILYCINTEHQNNLLKNALKDVYNKKHKKIIQESEIIFRNQDSFYLGKINEHFWLYSNEGELWGAGKEIQNTCNLIRDVFYFPVNDKSVIEDIFERKGFNTYESISNEYRIFCESLELKFNEDEDYWQSQAEDFYSQYKL